MPFLLVQSLSSDLEGKVAEVATKVNKSGKSINDHDKEVVLAVCGYLSDVREKKKINVCGFSSVTVQNKKSYQQLGWIMTMK